MTPHNTPATNSALHAETPEPIPARTTLRRHAVATLALFAVLVSPLTVTASAQAVPQVATADSAQHPHDPSDPNDDWDHDWDDDWDHDWDDDWDDPVDPTDEPTDEPETEPETEPEDDTDTAGGDSKSKVITVASVNINRYMSRAKVLRDRAAVLRRGSLDVIGWQEADRYRESFDAFTSKGWETTRPNGAVGCPISWRRSVFEFVSTHTERLNQASRGGTARTAHILTLKHRSTGQRVTFINAHILPKIENKRRPGTPRGNSNSRIAARAFKKLAGVYSSSTSATTIGTGDYNWDYLADSRVRHPKGVLARIGPYAESSYERLGTSLIPTHGRRLIDYVFLRRNSAAEFVEHRTLRGYRSDHKPLLAKVALR